MHYFVLQHLEEEEKAGCFAFIVLQMYCYYTCSVWFFLKVPWVGLQCVVLVFPDHTLLLFTCFSSSNHSK